jgi:endogenous inhibitor of DNA gyrase (YacG/DUF329 family)
VKRVGAWKILLAIGLLTAVAGCGLLDELGVTETAMNYYTSCAWCGKRCYETQEYGLRPMTQTEYRAWKSKNAIWDDAGEHAFCSLRCKNAAAATGTAKETVVPRNQ